MLPKIWPAVLALGWILLVTAGGEVLMALVGLADRDAGAKDFAVSAAITAAVAGACILTTKGRPFELRFRDAALLTAVSWFVVPAFAALPLMWHPIGLSFVDAYFEMVSGFTTTGSTVMTGLDTMPASILLWRSTVQWLGGLGIIGLAIIILPFLRIGGMQLFRMESSDRSEDVMPKAGHVAGLVGRVYVFLTVACALTYWALGMSPFDALNHALTTLPTAGFSTHDASFGYFHSPALEWASVVFMISGALPMIAYLRVLRPGRWRERIDPQIPVFIAMLAAFVLIVTLYVWLTGQLPFFSALTEAAFNITSVITTTGFASTDYLKWGPFVAVAFFLFNFPGGCTGSTAGGLKTFRLMVLYRLAAQHVTHLLHPHRTSRIHYGRKVMTDDEVGSVGTFAFLYLATFVVLSLAVGLTGLDMETAMSSVAECMANVGPGIGPIVGPAGNFASLPDVSKLLLTFAMIVGRLEIQGVLILFLPSFYL